MDENISARKLDWDEVPVIDLSPWFQGNYEAQKKVADEVVSACCTSGFFYIVNHQVPQQLLASVFEVAGVFFALPVEQKEKVSFELGNKNRGYIPLGGESSDPNAKRMKKRPMILPIRFRQGLLVN